MSSTLTISGEIPPCTQKNCSKGIKGVGVGLGAGPRRRSVRSSFPPHLLVHYGGEGQAIEAVHAGVVDLALALVLDLSARAGRGAGL